MGVRSWRGVLTIGVALFSTACTVDRELRPALAAQEISGQPNAAAASDAGVHLTADMQAWEGNPPTLDQVVMPIQIAIENASTHPLRVRYSEFRLRGPALDYRPLPPRKLVYGEVTVTEDPILVPRIVSERFRVAPHLYPNFPGFDRWNLPWEDDPGFYATQYAKWKVSLPTVDMIDRAIPEGVLEPGGRIVGFMYFEPLRPGLDRVRLDFDLVDAKSQLNYGRIEIPLRYARTLHWGRAAGR